MDRSDYRHVDIVARIRIWPAKIPPGSGRFTGCPSDVYLFVKKISSYLFFFFSEKKNRVSGEGFSFGGPGRRKYSQNYCTGYASNTNENIFHKQTTDNLDSAANLFIKSDRIQLGNEREVVEKTRTQSEISIRLDVRT